ncbi:RNA polymerase sigma factor [Candidatus Poriferisodalis sp.]|uniref:RNA polymerase sigma factor n=1 Tax=Candidatus Poriferisodalis sp. TaxID=3101277 RepID=UPI003B52E2AE
MALRLEDRDLVIAYQAGDDEAFAELVREYRPQLLGHARRSLGCPEMAEDAVQEALVRALRAMPRFNGNYRVGPWLHRILSNVCSDEGNRQRREGEKVQRFGSNDKALTQAPNTESELGLDIDDSELLDAIDGLSEQYREALMLRFVDELSYEEVAEAAGVSEDNARARVSRARNAVRAALRLAAVAPVALIGLLRRGERAASALSASSPGSGRSALHSAMPLLSETAPMASRAAAATANAATTGVPIVAKAAMGLGLATAVIAPTVDSPVHRAAERVLPDSVMDVLTPFAVEVPAPDAPVVVPAAAAVTDAETSSAAAAAAAGAPAIVEIVDSGSTENSAASETPDDSASASASGAAASPASDAAALSDAETTEDSSAATASQAGTEPTVSTVTMASADDVALTFVSAGADRFDVSGALTLTLTTTTTTTDGNEITETVTTSTESINVVAPSNASLSAADPSDPEAQQRFSALLVLAPSDGDNVEMRLAARGSAVDGSLPLEGVFTATPSETLPLTERGSLSGTMVLSGDGTPQSLTLTLGP